MALTLYTNPAGLRHDTGPGHPESQARLAALRELFEEEPAFAALPLIETGEAAPEQLYRAHDINYIMSLEERLPDHGLSYLDADTVLCPDSWDAALQGAGAVCRAVDDIASGADNSRAFCAIRPPGHHAEPGQAMGFCLLNNIFIGARHAQEVHGLRRIAIIDFDVHHGNGTDSMTRRAADIFYISTHQFPCYPGTGDPADNIDGKILNCALPPGSGSTAFRAAYTDIILPALDEFKPDLLMISAGFDAHRADPLAQLELTESDFNWLTAALVKTATRHCHGKIVSALEGGYNLEALKTSVAAHLEALL